MRDTERFGLRQLEAVVAVATEGSFTAAARTLQASQSSLSRAVLEVERQARAVLFQRDTRNLSLTPHGREFVQVAQDILDRHRDGLERFRRFSAGEYGRLRIVTVPSVASVMLPNLLGLLQLTVPGVEVEVHDSLPESALDQLTRGTADFAITVESESLYEFDAQPLVCDQLVALARHDHPIGQQGTVTWRALASEDLVSLGHAATSRRLADAAFRRAGVRPNFKYEVIAPTTQAGIVKSGLGVGLIPTMATSLLDLSDLAVATITAPTIERRVMLYRHPERGLPPSAQHFLDLLTQASQSNEHPWPGVRWIAEGAF